MRSPFLYAEVLMKTLDELWYGNISPFEQCTRGDKRLKELLKLVARNREELDGTLTDKQKETLEKFEECMNEMHSITERDAFSYGFQLGVQLMAESFLQPMGEYEPLKKRVSVIKEKPRRGHRKSMGHFDPLIFMLLPFVRNLQNPIFKCHI